MRWLNGARWIGHGAWRHPWLAALVVAVLLGMTGGACEPWDSPMCEQHPHYDGCL